MRLGLLVGVGVGVGVIFGWACCIWRRRGKSVKKGNDLGLRTDLLKYIDRVSVRDTAIAAKLRAETLLLPRGGMMISPDEAQVLHTLVRLVNARKAIEVGVFTGYSALITAQAMPADGRLIACDVSEEWTAAASRYWTEAGVSHKIDLRIAPACKTLEELCAKTSERGTYDFAFIDADKSNQYYEQCLLLLRKGGIIVLDNMLWHGKVVDESVHDADTVAIRELNEEIHRDERVDACLLPVCDGMYVCLKR